MSTTNIRIKNVSHIRIAGAPNQFCAWPVMGGLHDFGNGEIAILFVQGTSDYRTPEDVAHYTVESRAKIMLRRSLDYGETWPEDLAVEVFDNSIPLDDLIPQGAPPVRGLEPEDGEERSSIDMSKPESILYMGRSMITRSRVASAVRTERKRYLYPGRPIPFVLRSADKGYTWERPPILVPLYHLDSANPLTRYVKSRDGSIMFGLPGRIGSDADRAVFRTELYRSTDNGESWYWANTVFRDPANELHGHYPHLLLLPSGRLACTLGLWLDPRSRVRFMGIVYSEDGGLNWTELHRISWWGISPFPLMLRDGRMLLLYAWRQSRPYGIRGMISEDEGWTWSDEFVIRDDAASPDLGYPVATERQDGSIFTAYYYNLDEQPFFRGGPRHIAGTVFSLD